MQSNSRIRLDISSQFWLKGLSKIQKNADIVYGWSQRRVISIYTYNNHRFSVHFFVQKTKSLILKKRKSQKGLLNIFISIKLSN